MSKNKKLWKCVGAIPVTNDCTNSIVATNDDKRLTTHGDQWVKLYWDKQKRYLPNSRYYTCDDCKSLFEKWSNKINEKMFLEMTKVFNN